MILANGTGCATALPVQAVALLTAVLPEGAGCRKEQGTGRSRGPEGAGCRKEQGTGRSRGPEGAGDRKDCAAGKAVHRKRCTTENGGPRTARRSRTRCGYACLVSQKILLISSILPSSSSALPASTVPLVPAAPASLVASLNSWCSCGYFAKCGGLK